MRLNLVQRWFWERSFVYTAHFVAGSVTNHGDAGSKKLNFLQRGLNLVWGLESFFSQRVSGSQGSQEIPRNGLLLLFFFLFFFGGGGVTKTSSKLTLKLSEPETIKAQHRSNLAVALRAPLKLPLLEIPKTETEETLSNGWFLQRPAPGQLLLWAIGPPPLRPGTFALLPTFQRRVTKKPEEKNGGGGGGETD